MYLYYFDSCMSEIETIGRHDANYHIIIKKSIVKY